MPALATWCVRHRRAVLLIWLLVLVTVTALSRSVGSAYTNNFSLPNTESTKALALLQAASPSVAGDREQIVFHTTGGAHVTDPAIQQRVDAVLAQINTCPTSRPSAVPYGPAEATQVSADRTTAFANVTFDKLAQNVPSPVAKQFVATAQTGRRARAGGGGGRAAGRGGQQAVVRRHAGRGHPGRHRAATWCSARSSPCSCRCCRLSPPWARPSGLSSC